MSNGVVIAGNPPPKEKKWSESICTCNSVLYSFRFET
jgi:hypothetical protein